MSQQTAVKWLEQEINKVWKGDIMYMELPRDVYYRLLEQAEAMEKEQIIQAYRDGIDIDFYDDGSIDPSTSPYLHPLDYYNEKYNKQTMTQQNQSETVELPEEIKNEVIKDLEGKVFDIEEEYTVHVLTPRERARLCLKIKPGVKFAAHVEDNEKVMDYHNIPRYILLEKK
jgi:hypothetical protein